MVTRVRARYQSLTSKSLIGKELNILHRVHYGWYHVTGLVRNTTHPLTTYNQQR